MIVLDQITENYWLAIEYDGEVQARTLVAPLSMVCAWLSTLCDKEEKA